MVAFTAPIEEKDELADFRPHLIEITDVERNGFLYTGYKVLPMGDEKYQRFTVAVSKIKGHKIEDANGVILLVTDKKAKK